MLHIIVVLLQNLLENFYFNSKIINLLGNIFEWPMSQVLRLIKTSITIPKFFPRKKCFCKYLLLIFYDFFPNDIDSRIYYASILLYCFKISVQVLTNCKIYIKNFQANIINEKQKVKKYIFQIICILNFTVKCTIVLIQINSQTYLEINIKAKIYRLFSLLDETVQNVFFAIKFI